MWLDEYGEEGEAAIFVDSLYAGNEIEGCWEYASQSPYGLVRSRSAYTSAPDEECDVRTRGAENVDSDLSERHLERLGHSLGHV